MNCQNNSDLNSNVSQSSCTSLPNTRSADPYRLHLHKTFQGLNIARTLRHPSAQELREKQISLPRRSAAQKTVVFDLDETLVHFCQEPDRGQHLLTIKGPQPFVGSLNVRPFAREVLEAASQHFEVVVFTASEQFYADTVLDWLDPVGSLIHHRLYRHHCLFVDGYHVKDLRLLTGRALSDVVIVDNSAMSFAYQLDNAVPIVSWFDDAEDRELFNLINYLARLARQSDVRLLNRQQFNLHTFCEDYVKELPYLKM